MIIVQISLIVMWSVNAFFAYGLCALVMKRRFNLLIEGILFMVSIALIFTLRYNVMFNKGLSSVPNVSALTMLATFLLQVVLLRGKWYVQLMNYAIVSVFGIAAEVVAAFVASNIVGEYESLNFSDVGFRFSIMLYAPVLSLFIFPALLLLRKINRLADSIISPGYMWLVVAFPLSQALMINLYSGVTTVVKTIGLFGALLGLVADFLLIALLEKEHKNYQLQNSLEEEKQLLRYEKLSYQDLVLRQEEIAQLRHDYQNQMLALKALK